MRIGAANQAHVAGLAIGVMAIKPDHADPEAVVGIYDPERGEPASHRVRPGDRIQVAGRTVAVTGIAPEGRGRIEVVVSWAEGGDEA